MKVLAHIALLIPLAACSGGCTGKLPLWSGQDVKVTARERDSVKKCGTGEVTADGAKLITRQPYLQSTTTTSTVVAWGSVAGKGEVQLVEPGGDRPLKSAPAVYAGDPSRERARLAAQRYNGADLHAENLYILEAELRDLEPGHLYCYQIRYEGRALTKPAPLVTAAPPNQKEPIHFVALGDSGTGTAAQLAIAKRVSAEPFDFMLFLGDIAYSSGTANELQTKFFAIYRDFMKYVPVYPTIGNHERRTREGRPYFEAFVLPDPERYYSFEWGDVHFVAIDTTHRDSDQLIWLDRDLAQNQRKWVIVYGHHPMYTNALRGAQLSIRRAFAQIFTRHRVDLVVTGHEHQYERFKVSNVNYVVSGGGGGQLYGFAGHTRAITQASVHHFLAFEASEKALVMRAIDIEGKEIEMVRLEKPFPAAKPRVKVDGQPETKQTPVAPEKKTVPDEKLHDEPDDDVHKNKVDPKQPTPPPKKKPDADPKKKPVAQHP